MLAAIGASIGFCGQIVTLTSVADTTLIQTQPDNNLGGQKFFNAGITQNVTTNRGLFRFDLTEAIPPHSKILSAQVILEVTGKPKDDFAAGSFHLHRLLRPWGEGNKIFADPRSPGLGEPATPNEATWNHRFAFTTNTWTTPGAAATHDYVASASAEQAIYDIGDSPYLFGPTAQLAEDVQAWLDNPQTNFGWLLKSVDEATPFTARRFGSREDADHAPRLEVEFFAPLHIDAAQKITNQFQLSFGAEAGQSYTVQYRDSLAVGNWLTLTNLAAHAATTNVVVTDSLAVPQRFYRLETR